MAKKDANKFTHHNIKFGIIIPKDENLLKIFISKVKFGILWCEPQFLGNINFVNVEFKPKLTYINIINQ